MFVLIEKHSRLCDQFIVPSHISGPNIITVEFSGDISLGTHLVLHDVLYVPQFKFNLISVSALTKKSRLTMIFYPDSFLFTRSTIRGRLARVDALKVYTCLSAIT